MGAPINPYQAPSSTLENPQPRRDRWRRPSVWIGGAEILLGVSISFKACTAAIDRPPAPGLAMLVGFVVPNLLVTLPGFALTGQARHRWVLQAVPLLFIAWVVAAFGFR